LSGKIYAVGGNGFFSPALQKDVMQQYDPETDACTLKAPMPVGRSGLAAAAVNGKVYAIGGDDECLFNRVDEYDPTQDR